MAKRRKGAARRRAPAVVVVRQNPTKRRRRAGAKRRGYNYLMNPRRRRGVRRYRRNPSLRGGSEKLMNLIVPAAGIGLGAVITEIGVGYLPLPAQLKTGTMLYITKGAVGIGAGLVVGQVLRQKRLGKYIAAGAVAIAVHDAVKSLIIKSMPSVKFGQFVPASYGMHGLGYGNPAPLVAPSAFGEFVPPIHHGLAGVNGGGGETDFSV